MRMDRFTFYNDTQCFIELGSPEEARKAVDQFNGFKIHERKLIAAPLKDDFRWGPVQGTNQPFGSRYFYSEGNAVQEALRPLIEGRRTLLSVKTPGWSPKTGVREAKEAAHNIIAENFGHYGIESISDISPFYGDMKSKPRMLCFIDFKTKEGADQAMKEKDETEINDRLVWLKPTDPSPWRNSQYSKYAPQLIEELQEKGVLKKEMYDDKFNTPRPRKARN